MPTISWILCTWSSSFDPGNSGRRLHKCNIHYSNGVNKIQYIVRVLRSKSESYIPHNFKEHTPNTPHVHLVTIVAISEQALWGSIPDNDEIKTLCITHTVCVSECVCGCV